MKDIHAVFADGVFRPSDPVNLPDHCEVLINIRPLNQDGEEPSEAGPGSWDEVYEILSHRHFNWRARPRGAPR
ncbi:MAG: antitoxin family protein [Isosphaeraceae bacterium]